MNYFELHIGDLTEATAHLSMVEDGAYGRLLRKYYATEKPLPADVAKVQRLVGARTKEEREAVETVLTEFFELLDDGWHQSRCDAEISAFHAKQIDREAERENAKERQRRARERRKELFEALRQHGIVPPMTTTNAELETMLSRVTDSHASRDVTPPVTRDITATQTPDSKHQTPDSSSVGGAAAAQPTTPTSKPAKPKKVKTGEVTLAEWLAAEAEAGRKAVPSDDPIFAWADSIQLPREFLHLAWIEFKARYTAPPVRGARQKGYTDWRAVFRKACREGWLKLWAIDGQHYVLTTAGQQARRAHEATAGAPA